MTGKCAGGYELPKMDKPCVKCGATSREPCPEFIRQQQDEIALLKQRFEDAKGYVKRAIASYERDPADNNFQRGFLAALEVVRDEAFSLSSHLDKQQ